MRYKVNGFRLKTLKNSLPKQINITKIEIIPIIDGILSEYQVCIEQSKRKEICIKVMASEGQMVLEIIKQEVLNWYGVQEKSKLGKTNNSKFKKIKLLFKKLF